jgi:hypothetical protein
MKYNFQPGETPIDTWSINYRQQTGGQNAGKLTVTNKRLIYNSRVDKFFFEINKNEIASVQVQKSFLAKKAIVILLDGSRHTFNYGVLNIDKLVEAININ